MLSYLATYLYDIQLLNSVERPRNLDDSPYRQEHARCCLLLQEGHATWKSEKERLSCLLLGGMLCLWNLAWVWPERGYPNSTIDFRIFSIVSYSWIYSFKKETMVISAVFNLWLSSRFFHQLWERLFASKMGHILGCKSTTQLRGPGCRGYQQRISDRFPGAKRLTTTLALVRGKKWPGTPLFEIFRMFRPFKNINPQSPMGKELSCVGIPGMLWSPEAAESSMAKRAAEHLARPVPSVCHLASAALASKGFDRLTYDFCLGAAAEHARKPESRWCSPVGNLYIMEPHRFGRWYASAIMIPCGHWPFKKRCLWFHVETLFCSGPGQHWTF